MLRELDAQLAEARAQGRKVKSTLKVYIPKEEGRAGAGTHVPVKQTARPKHPRVKQPGKANRQR